MRIPDGDKAMNWVTIGLSAEIAAPRAIVRLK